MRHLFVFVVVLFVNQMELHLKKKQTNSENMDYCFELCIYT